MVKSLALWHLAMCHKSLGNFEKAFEYLLAESRMDSILYTEKNARIMHDMETKYRVDEISLENELLRQQDEILAAKLREQVLITWFVGSAFGLFLIFTAVLLIANKKIKRQKQQIGLQA